MSPLGHQRSSGDACAMSVITSAATQSTLDGVYLHHPPSPGAPAVCDGRLEPFTPGAPFSISKARPLHSLP